jgi:peptidoglycan hydrolase-like protein with peptidoglycan-binding domain
MIKPSVLGLGVALLAGCSLFEPPADTGTATSPPPAYAPAPTAPPQPPATSLRRGSAGHGAVVSLQQSLQAKGYYWGSVDGVYGSATKTAVMSFQRDLGVPETGVAGHREWSALGLSAGSGPSAPPPNPVALEPTAPQ